MLALTRRVGQAIRIGDDVEVTIVRIEGDRVVLGVAAPRSTIVVRKELLDEVSAETRGAAAAREALRALLRDP
jgi:carbon storage regulator